MRTSRSTIRDAVGRGDGHRLGQGANRLGTAGGEDHECPVLGEGDLLADIGERAGRHPDEGTAGRDHGVDDGVGVVCDYSRTCMYYAIIA